MKNGLLGIINKLARKKPGVTFELLNNVVRGFKALPANGKRWKKGESPEICEVRFLTGYDTALELCRGSSCNFVAVIVYLPREEFEKLASVQEKEAA